MEFVLGLHFVFDGVAQAVCQDTLQLVHVLDLREQEGELAVVLLLELDFFFELIRLFVVLLEWVLVEERLVVGV